MSANPPFAKERALESTEHQHCDTNRNDDDNNISISRTSTVLTTIDPVWTRRTTSNIIIESDDDDEEISPLKKQNVVQPGQQQRVMDSATTWETWTAGLHPRTWTIQTFFKALLLLLLVTAIILVFAVFRIQDHMKEILGYIDDHKQIGAVLFVSFYTVACWLFLPGSLFTIGAGFLLKPFPFALGIVILGDVLGTIGTFLLGRYIFYDWVKASLSKHPKFGALDQVIKDDGWKIVVMIRLTPIPFNLITYFFSITSIHLWTMVWATVVGVFPGSCLGIWVGSLLKDLSGVENPDLETKNLVILAMNGVFIACSILILSIFGKQALRRALVKLDRHQKALDGSLEGVVIEVQNEDEDEEEEQEATREDLDDDITERDMLLVQPVAATPEESGFTRSEKLTFVAIALIAVANVCKN
ncbi:hypothetical protein BG004_000371 [Podila humilis]|nr:hypothetical protein BG004_000371 [Podila humilis]